MQQYKTNIRNNCIKGEDYSQVSMRFLSKNIYIYSKIK